VVSVYFWNHIKKTKIVTKRKTEETTAVGFYLSIKSHMHNQKNALLVHTLALGSVICGVNYNLIVRPSTYQHFETVAHCLQMVHGYPYRFMETQGFKMSLLFEYKHV